MALSSIISGFVLHSSSLVTPSLSSLRIWFLPACGVAESITLFSFFVSLIHSEVAVLVGLHFLSSCVRTTLLVQDALAPDRRNNPRRLLVLISVMVSSWSLFMLSGFMVLSSETDEGRSSYAKVTLLVFHSFYIATITSTIVADRAWKMYQPRRLRSTSMDQREGAVRGFPEQMRSLNDLIVRTCEFENLDAGGGEASVNTKAQDVCCICLCQMVPGEMVTELGCHHRYHRSCVEDWAASQIQRRQLVRCPLRCDVHTAIGRGAEELSSEEPRIYTTIV
eukprot:TRINITY_DN71576_c0_g1_i1.p1 TRINITY_DN71576_c0_g1~~TRINITY_DN71576_c0_g1_i1.p1  ORF type:complete len:279 (-),score=12.16 TRINITY_DN71576_c0_g1_i1:238-1074(-)